MGNSKRSTLRIKHGIADAFQELVRATPSSQIGKISVQKIADAAGVSKQTFYNYFLDKQDLIMWIFTRNFEDGILEEQGYVAWAKRSIEVVRNEEAYYLKVLRTTDFFIWLEKWLSDEINTYIVRHFDHTLSSAELHALDSWINGTIGTMLNDINKGTDIDWRHRGKMDLDIMPELLKKYFIV